MGIPASSDYEEDYVSEEDMETLNPPIKLELLPSTLTHLTFGIFFDNPVGDLLPLSLQHLTFGTYFNQPVDSLPPNLTHLRLGRFFNQNITSLPTTLLELKILGSSEEDSDFNAKIKYLPPGLVTLRTNTWALYLEVPLPDTILDLQFKYCDYQNRGVLPSLPPNLVRLECWEVWQPGADLCVLPASLTSLTLFSGDCDDPMHLPAPLPPNLKELRLDGNYILPPLPPSVTRLAIPWGWGKESESLTSADLPPNLTHLIIPFMPGGFRRNIHLASTPLVSLKLETNADRCSLTALPDTLKVLKAFTLWYGFKVPPHLEVLKIKRELARVKGLELPHSLCKLELGEDYGALLPPLPPNLTELTIGKQYDHPLPVLPTSLRVLRISCRYKHPLPPLHTDLKVVQTE